MNIMGTFTEEILNNIYKINKENTVLKKNWNNLKSVLEKQIDEYKDSECEELQAMVQEDKAILFLMREYEEMSVIKDDK